MVSLRPHVVFAIQLPPALGCEFSGQFVLGFANLAEQLVECFRRHLMASGQWAKHVDQKQANAENFCECGFTRIVFCFSALQLCKDQTSYQLARSDIAFPAVFFESYKFVSAELGSSRLNPYRCARPCTGKKLLVAE